MKELRCYPVKETVEDAWTAFVSFLTDKSEEKIHPDSRLLWGKDCDEYLVWAKPDTEEAVVKLIEPYLQDQSSLRIEWAVACLRSWGGCKRLNNQLTKNVVHNSDLDYWVRAVALHAVAKSGDMTAVTSALKKIFSIQGPNDSDIWVGEVATYVEWRYRDRLPGFSMRDLLSHVKKYFRRNRLFELWRIIDDFASGFDEKKLKDGFAYMEQEFEW